MRVGVTCRMEYSVFSCGSTNTSVALAELMKLLGHEVTLINFTANSWWDDCLQVKKMFASVNRVDVNATDEKTPFDLILEVGSYTLKAEERKKFTKSSVWIIRKPFVLGEIESSIYPMSDLPRNMDGISETWLLSDVTSPDDVTALETLTRKPVSILPFLWTPILAEVHYRSIEGKPWSVDPTKKLVVHMVDTNSTSSSNSTLPLVIMREAGRLHLPIESWKLHNGEGISNSKFFQENVLKHCIDTDISGECVGRQRCVDWTLDTNHIALAHIRFRNLRPVLIDLSWVGIPVVHNSPVLRDIGLGLDKFFYSENSVKEGAFAINNVVDMVKNNFSTWSDNLIKRREEILKKWSPVSPFIRDKWLMNVNKFNSKAGGSIPVPLSVAPEFTILFCDMWDGFQADYNFFTLMLNEAGKQMIPPKSVKGYSQSTLNGLKPSLIIFGPFGNTFTEYPEIPKVHFTGENTKPIQIPGLNIKLNLAFGLYDMIYESYLRFPLWYTEINWFNADINRLVNPKPIPLELCTRTNEKTFSERSKFCSFIVSNPRNSVRNNAYHWLNSYKQVDSAGALYNTVGPELFAMQGGGGGEIKKTKFMMDYKFAITYENNSEDGYTTEKYLHAKAAGVVPIYWGDPKFHRDFNTDGCIDARNVKTPGELIELVKACESEEEWCKKAAVPALDEYKVELVRRTMAECSKRIYSIMGADISSAPDAIGAKKGSPEALVGMNEYPKKDLVTAVQPLALKPVEPLQVPLLVTYVTFKFLGSLQHWLLAAKNQLRAIPDMKAIVFVGPDINKETIEALREQYKYADFEEVPSSWTPPDFDDFWEPTHFAWKIWIYHTLVHRESLKGKLILYMDAGAVLVRWPRSWMEIASKMGIACLEDPREENDRWCGDAFCERLGVTDEERSFKQIVAGIMCFVGGNSVATEFFDKAFVYAQERDTIVGPRLSGVSTDGKSYGHRQDQSILSILVRRYPIPLHPLDTVYCDHSMRRTFQSGKAIYVHRGNFKKSIPFIPGIEDAYVINLDRRSDRMEKFWKSHPELEDRVHRHSAYDGTKMTMTPELATLFKPNDFFWKKAVTGCAMSHLSLWWKLVNEHPDVNNYLIFEDDAQLQPGWEDILEASMAHVPEDYDVLYLGGILPPNRPGFEHVQERVTKYYSRIKPHQIFGQPVPTRYFHSCAYAYILSRKGAVKIMEGIEAKKGYWTSADHMLCSPCDVMNLYFLTPVVAGCFQDSDPAYANSDFNNFSRVDKFDSDLWNNDERFPIPDVVVPEPYDLRKIMDAINHVTVPVKPAAVVPVEEEVAKVVDTSKPYTTSVVIDSNTNVLPVRFLCLKGHDLDFSKIYESDWLFSLLDIKSASIDTFDESCEPPTDTPIVIIQRPHIDRVYNILKVWSERGHMFKILHLSDEITPEIAHADSLEIYRLTGCKSVLRFYVRDDFPKGTESKIQVIPLGYHWSKLNLSQHPFKRTPNLPFREIHWSFYGTSWRSREAEMQPLIESNLISSYKFYSDWNDPTNLSKAEYTNILLNTVFVPCPDGMNPETFRFYEALEAGCIPIVIHTSNNDTWFRWISSYIPLLDIKSWNEAVKNMVMLLSNEERLTVYRKEILNSWVNLYTTLKGQTRTWLLN